MEDWNDLLLADTMGPTTIAPIVVDMREEPIIRREALRKAVEGAIALVLLILISPAFLVIAALVRQDGGPVIYPHRRIGRHGRTFRCLKFRTMHIDSDRMLDDLVRRDPEAAREWRETHKLRNDPRITKVGAFLRKTSLDELPQLLNVLRGEMGLVGPRPIVGQEVPRYAENICWYYSVRPGMTGLWQVSGRSETSYQQRVDLDVAYVKERSPRLDTIILLRTLPAVVARRGAL